MDTKFLREVKDYSTLIDSLPVTFTDAASTPDTTPITDADFLDTQGGLVSLTSAIVAMDFAAAVQIRKHIPRSMRQCWPVHMSLLHHKHALLCPVVNTSCTVSSMISLHGPLRKKLDDTAASFGIESHDVRHVLAKRVAKMLERVFETCLMIRHLAECKEDEASPWDVVVNALKFHADQDLVDRVLKRVSDMIVEVPPQEQYRNKWMDLAERPPRRPSKKRGRKPKPRPEGVDTVAMPLVSETSEPPPPTKKGGRQPKPKPDEANAPPTSSDPNLPTFITLSESMNDDQQVELALEDPLDSLYDPLNE